VLKARTILIAISAGAGSLLLGIIGPYGLEWLYDRINLPGAAAWAISTQAALFLLGFVVGAFVGNWVLNLFQTLDERWDRMDAGDKVSLMIGVFAGVLISVPFMVVFTGLGVYIATIASFALMFGVCALTVYALRSMEDVLPWYKKQGRARKRGIKLLDTSVIIDARIYDVIRTGFLDGQIYVPGFVLEELQRIADSAEPLRRQRGRRGLEVLRHLQAEHALETGAQDRLAPPSSDGVDGRLVRLAKALGADVVTNDFNLNRVASLQEVRVLNVNDLALAMRPNLLPRESLTVSLVREGNQPGQGIGYLDDGTMVVVEQAKRLIGETVGAVVTQVIQTERGKMIFAELTMENGEGEPEGRRRAPRKGPS
jgi:uncharacterized protein YacL